MTNVIRTKFSAALIRALDECNQEGRNPGRVGRHILTAKMKGTGIKHVIRTKKTIKNINPAVAA